MRNQESEHLALSLSPKRPSSKGTFNQHPLINIIATLSKEQHHTFSTLSQKCSSIEYAMGTVEVLVAQMTQKVQKFNESRESEMLGSLKMKQSDFIIGQLKSTISKQAKKQEKILDELDAEKKKTEKYREEIYKLEAKNTSLSEKIGILQTSLRKKAQQIESVNASINKLRFDHDNQTRNRNRSVLNRESLSSIRSTEEYAELQSKLEQLQKQFNSQIQKLVNRNNDLSFELKKLQDSNIDILNSNKTLKRELQDLSIAKYELQIKSRQDLIQMNELEQTYNKLVEKSNNNEIMLHKQLQDHKVKEAEIKNQYKKEKKLFKAYLSLLAEHINSTKYYFTNNQLKDQIEELKKLYDKNLKKKLETFTRELEYYQTQYKKTKLKAEELEQKSSQIQRIRSVMISSKQIEVDTIERVDRNSENGSLLNNRSSDRSEQEKYRGVEEKYKGKLEALRKDIKSKQAKINELEKLQQIQFDKSKQKILELQFLISEKTNEIRKFQLKFKEKEYQFSQFQAKIKQLEGKIKFFTEKLQSEKESNSKLVQIKSQNYEQKLKVVKTNYRQLQKKQQQKTVRYNKLRSKFEKYELEASQSLKRKNAQIDQLLKENNKCKAENKLLEEKISINTIIESQISKNKTPTSAVNQDLIEQIEMQRDRISLTLADKEKKVTDLVDMNEKINMQMVLIRKQNRQLRNKVQQLTREQRIIKEQIKYAKQKIQELSKSNKNQDEQKHSYFKKQLEKSVINVKKLEKSCEKYAIQREQKRKQLEQKDKEIANLKTHLEKIKQKRKKLENELRVEKQSRERAIVDYERKLSQYTTREEQLVEIINYKNREGEGIRQSMKGQQLILEEQAKIKFNMDTMTDKIILEEKAVNTDMILPQVQHKINQHVEKQIIPSQIFLENDLLQDSLEKSHKHSVERAIIKETPPKLVNYFGDLIMAENEQDHFDICEEGEQQIFGKGSTNAQIKQSFNVLRQSLQRLFNEQDISVSAVKLLPKQLEDDFNDFISYIKQKICQIKNENNLTFIMAEAGNEPSNIESEILEFIQKPSVECIKMKKIIEEKEYMITSLMNEKTEQENTINQQQNMQEENERLHLQQYSVLKNEIHDQKQDLDKQLLYYQSLKNILKKMMNFWIEDEDNYDDFEDNLQLITTIYKFNSKEMQLLKLYLNKYRELKQIQ